jgi:hypothetical protein
MHGSRVDEEIDSHFQKKVSTPSQRLDCRLLVRFPKRPSSSLRGGLFRGATIESIVVTELPKLAQPGVLELVSTSSIELEYDLSDAEPQVSADRTLQ